MIRVELLQDSINEKSRITTFVLEYPRYIHAELMTHRSFSRNAASSRAIPVERLIDLVINDPLVPHWTVNQRGMQGEKATLELVEQANKVWASAAASAVAHAKRLAELGIHKQNANRILEPFQLIKVVVTATEFNNFFALRCHPDAQPEIRALAEAMQAAMAESTPEVLRPGELHVPYVERGRDADGNMLYLLNGEKLCEEHALMVSASCCAQVSYRILNDSLEQATRIYTRLAGSIPVHASPFEHQARAMLDSTDRCRNFVGWKQHRTDIPQETVF